jgi:hypothetical protein
LIQKGTFAVSHGTTDDFYRDRVSRDGSGQKLGTPVYYFDGLVEERHTLLDAAQLGHAQGSQFYRSKEIQEGKMKLLRMTTCPRP